MFRCIFWKFTKQPCILMICPTCSWCVLVFIYGWTGFSNNLLRIFAFRFVSSTGLWFPFYWNFDIKITLPQEIKLDIVFSICSLEDFIQDECYFFLKWWKNALVNLPRPFVVLDVVAVVIFHPTFENINIRVPVSLFLLSNSGLSH